jgi:hypothetical protein
MVLSSDTSIRERLVGIGAIGEVVSTIFSLDSTAGAMGARRVDVNGTSRGAIGVGGLTAGALGSTALNLDSTAGATGRGTSDILTMFGSVSECRTAAFTSEGCSRV